MAERIIQLAKNYDSLSLKAKKGLFDHGYASEKLDGVWVAAKCQDGNVEFFSSTLEDYCSLNYKALEDSIKALHIGSWTNFVLIAEAYIPGVDQQVISGKCRTKERGAAEGVQLWVHDILSIEEWQAGESRRPYSQRWLNLRTLMDWRTTDVLKLVDTYTISSEEQFIEFAKRCKTRGGEGACYRHAGALWKSGDRGTNLIRDKEKITYDLEVTGVGDVGTGERGGLTGVIFVRFRQYGDTNGIPVDIPVRGMTHDQLRAWAEDPSLIVGKIVEVHAMKFTNLGMLREPRFKSVREDKTIADL